MPNRAYTRWSKKDTLIAFNLFCKTNFGRIDDRNPEIIELAERLGRSPGAVVMKMLNLASFDPNQRARGVLGLRHASRIDRLIWEEFNKNPGRVLTESQFLAGDINDKEIAKEILSGQVADEDTEVVTTARIGQKIFRDTILAAYEGKCCITGVSEPKLLIASHIIPWRERVERLNPRNGLCLNALHDKAYDCGLISVGPDFRVVVSEHLREAAERSEKIRFITESHGKPIEQPNKFSPEPEFLEHHYQKIFLDNL